MDKSKKEKATKVKTMHYNKWLRLTRRGINEKVNAHLLAIGKAAFNI